PVTYTLESGNWEAYVNMAESINRDNEVDIVYIQHEFGLFGGHHGDYLLGLLLNLQKPYVISFHTVLPSPDKERLELVQVISRSAASVVVITEGSVEILHNEYG